MERLHVQQYLRENTLYSLASPPFNLCIKEDGNLVLLKYNQIESDFSLPIVNECRGLILEKWSWRIVCYPFQKFFNVGEQYAAELEGKKLFVYDKEDGMLAKVYYYDGEWRLASNGNIDARKVEISNRDGNFNFFDLFCRALSTYNLTWEKFTSYLTKGQTYMYELCTQDSVVIIPYEGYRLYYLGERNNETFDENFTPQPFVDNVKQYDFNSLEDVVESAKHLPDDAEGYVVRDEYFNRIKVKNPTYFLLHRMSNDGKPDILGRVLMNNTEELLTYFPQYRQDVEAYEAKLQEISNEAEEVRKKVLTMITLPRAEYASFVIRKIPKKYRAFAFWLKDVGWRRFTLDWSINKWKKFLEEE